VTLLITSRERLALSAEWVFDLEGLPYPLEPASTGESPDPAQFAAVRLFLDRARQGQRLAAPEADELPAVVRICQLVQGLPLALELAAAARRQQSSAAIALELESGLAALATTLRDVPARHRSMWAACDHSYRLLAPAEQAAFRQLSVFQGGFPAEAAGPVAGADARLLLSLADKSLLRALGEGRFELHAVLRQYAHSLLAEAGEAAAAEQRHGLYFLDWAEQAEPHLQGPEESQWLAALERDHDNLRAALRWSLRQPEPQLALRLAGSLWRFWFLRGYAGEGRRWLVAALAAASAGGAAQPLQRAQALALDGAGILAYQQGDQDRAAQACGQAASLFRELGDKASLATALNHIGLLWMDRGGSAQAMQAYEESAALSRELGNPRGLANALHNLGNLATLNNQNELAEQVYEECLAIHRASGDRSGIALLSLGLGTLARRAGNLPRAQAMAEQSLAVAVELGDQWNVAAASNDLGLAAFDRGDYSAAAAQIEAARAIYAAIGAQQSEAETLFALAMVGRVSGNLPLAAQHLRAGLILCQAGQHAVAIGEGLEQAARLAWALAQPAEAAQIAAAAAALRAAGGNSVSIIDLEPPTALHAALKKALGEPAFTASWAAGEALNLEQALSLALSVAGPPGFTARP
jgi:predicted ATPase